MCSIHTTRSSNKSFEIICKEVWENFSLSCEAKSLWTYVINHISGWRAEFNELRRKFRWGRDKLYRIFNELIEFGFCRKIMLRDSRGQYSKFAYEILDELVYASDNPLPNYQEMVHIDCEQDLPRKSAKKNTLSSSKPSQKPSQPFPEIQKNKQRTGSSSQEMADIQSERDFSKKKRRKNTVPKNQEVAFPSGHTNTLVNSKYKNTTTPYSCFPTFRMGSSSFSKEDKRKLELLEDMDINERTRRNLLRFDYTCLETAVYNTKRAKCENVGAYLYDQARNNYPRICTKADREADHQRQRMELNSMIKKREQEFRQLEKNLEGVLPDDVYFTACDNCVWVGRGNKRMPIAYTESSPVDQVNCALQTIGCQVDIRDYQTHKPKKGFANFELM